MLPIGGIIASLPSAGWNWRGTEAVELVRERLGDDVPLLGGDGRKHSLGLPSPWAVVAMPGMEVVDRLVEVWGVERAAESGRADDMFTTLPLLVFEPGPLRRYVTSAKHVVLRRGVLESERMRLPGAPTDAEFIAAA